MSTQTRRIQAELGVAGQNSKGNWSRKRKKSKHCMNFLGCENSQPTNFRNLLLCLIDPIFYQLCTFFLNYPLCIIGSIYIFVISLDSGQYISLSQGSVHGITKCNKFWHESFQFSRLFSFPSFSLIFSHFLTCQIPLEDDNSDDGWLSYSYP